MKKNSCEIWLKFTEKGVIFMKKQLALLLTLLLLLGGCQQSPTSGVSPVSGSSAGESESQAQDAPAPSSSPQAAESSGSASLVAQEADALALPDILAVPAKGYGLTLLTPAQYDAHLDSGKGGPRGYLTGDCFLLERNGKTAVASPEGEIVTDFIYDGNPNGYWNAQNGGILLTKDGKEGVVDIHTGQEMIPFLYTRMIPTYQGTEGSSGYTALNEEGQEVCLDLQGNVLFTLKEGESWTTCTGGGYVLFQNGILTISDGQQQLASIPCDSYDLVGRGETEGTPDLIRVRIGEKYALYDSTGACLQNPVWDDIGYFLGGYTTVTKDGKVGIMDASGKVTAEPAWDAIYLYEHSASVLQGELWGAITDLAAGTVTIQPQYQSLSYFDSTGIACCQLNNKYGLVDTQNQLVLPIQYDNTLSAPAWLEEGYYLLSTNEGPGCYNILDKEGNVIFEGSIWANGLDDLVMASTADGKWGYLGSDGQFIIPAEYDAVGDFIPGTNVAFANKDGRILLLDRNGNTVLETVFSDVIGFCPDTMVCVMEYTAENGDKKCCLAKITLPG